MPADGWERESNPRDAVLSELDKAWQAGLGARATVGAAGITADELAEAMRWLAETGGGLTPQNIVTVLDRLRGAAPSATGPHNVWTCTEEIDRLTRALRVASHSPHDQAGGTNHGFPVCSVCGAIQTGESRGADAGDREPTRLGSRGHEPGDFGTPEWETNQRREMARMFAQLDLSALRPAAPADTALREALEHAQSNYHERVRHPGPPVLCDRESCPKYLRALALPAAPVLPDDEVTERERGYNHTGPCVYVCGTCGEPPGADAGDREPPARDAVDRMARVLMREWERVEGQPPIVGSSYVATFADLARAALAAAPTDTALRSALARYSPVGPDRMVPDPDGVWVLGPLAEPSPVVEAARRVIAWADHHQPWNPGGEFEALRRALLPAAPGSGEQ